MNRIWIKKEVYDWRDPVLPPHCRVIEGQPETGLVVQEENTGIEYVAMPVPVVKFQKNSHYVNKKELHSINKYKVFYVARYLWPCKVGSMPTTLNKLYEEGINLERMFKGFIGTNVQMMSGQAYDLMCSTIVRLGVLTYEEVFKDSTNVGNYWMSPKSPHKILPNGNNISIFNIDGLAGNLGELTSERHNQFYVWRGNHYGMGKGQIAARYLTLYNGKDDYIDLTPKIGVRPMLYL